MQDTPKPFFARFLEDQDYPQVESEVKAGPFGGGTLPSVDHLVTLKYPSDNDENSAS